MLGLRKFSDLPDALHIGKTSAQLSTELDSQVPESPAALQWFAMLVTLVASKKKETSANSKTQLSSGIVMLSESRHAPSLANTASHSVTFCASKGALLRHR